MDFGLVLSRAWQIFSRHKVLWLFGILAGCTSTNLGTSNVSYSFNQEDFAYRFQQPQFSFDGGSEWVLIALLILAAVFVLGLLAAFVGTAGRIGLIRGISHADDGKTHLTFSELFNESLGDFWRVFGINLLLWLVLPLLLLAVLFVLAISIVGIACLIPLVCLLAPISWALGILVQMIYHAIILDEANLTDAIRRGWEVFRTNLGSLLVMGLILMVISSVIGFVIGLPIILVMLPAIAGVIIGNEPIATGSFVVTALCIAGYIPVAIILNGLIQTYVQAAWTLTYRRLTGHEAPTFAV